MPDLGLHLAGAAALAASLGWLGAALWFTLRFRPPRCPRTGASRSYSAPPGTARRCAPRNGAMLGLAFGMQALVRAAAAGSPTAAGGSRRWPPPGSRAQRCRVW